MWLLIDQWWWWGEVDNDDDDEVDNDDDGVDDDDDEVDNDDNDDDDNEANLEAKNHLPRSLAGWPALIKTQIEAHFLQPRRDEDFLAQLCIIRVLWFSSESILSISLPIIIIMIIFIII